MPADTLHAICVDADATCLLLPLRRLPGCAPAREQQALRRRGTSLRAARSARVEPGLGQPPAACGRGRRCAPTSGGAWATTGLSGTPPCSGGKLGRLLRRRGRSGHALETTGAGGVSAGGATVGPGGDGWPEGGVGGCGRLLVAASALLLVVIVVLVALVLVLVLSLSCCGVVGAGMGSPPGHAIAFGAVIPMTKAAAPSRRRPCMGVSIVTFGRFLPGSMPKNRKSAPRPRATTLRRSRLSARRQGLRRLRRGDEPRIQQGLDLPFSAVLYQPCGDGQPRMPRV
jgi:uncharacterized protein YceK